MSESVREFSEGRGEYVSWILIDSVLAFSFKPSINEQCDWWMAGLVNEVLGRLFTEELEEDAVVD